MVRRKTCCGIGLATFGAGLICAVLLQSGVFVVLLGLGSIAAGLLMMN